MKIDFTYLFVLLYTVLPLNFTDLSWCIKIIYFIVTDIIYFSCDNLRNY
jgi:hypothetical protein